MKSYIVEWWSRWELSWQSETRLNTTIQEIQEYYWEQANIFRISQRELETISQQEFNKDENDKYLENMEKQITHILEYKKRRKAVRDIITWKFLVNNVKNKNWLNKNNI